MHKVVTIRELRDKISQWRAQGQKIAFVPTMGNLHAGHIKLVTEARKQADKVIVSIFVNPTQFGVGEDFESYPRTEQADEEKLTAASADLLFSPIVAEMYPSKANTTVLVGELTTLHCGAHRAGHFDGVSTIVTKLFNMVQPDIALFGEKDVQQLAVIKKMVEDLNSPIKIIGVATEREADGLALSSRNGYLNEQQRQIAPKLYRTLSDARKAIQQGVSDYRDMEQQYTNTLQAHGFQVDYFSICNAYNLQLATALDEELVILTAAKLGKPRLIDNIFFSKNK